MVKAAVDNFGVNMNNVVCEYCEISVFSHASVFRFGKSPIVSVLFAQSVTLSVLSVLICWSIQCFLVTGDVGTS